MRSQHIVTTDIEEWAIQILLHAQAIESCPGCGYKKLKFDRAAIEYAHELAKQEKLRGVCLPKCIGVLDEILDSLGDECPSCS